MIAAAQPLEPLSKTRRKHAMHALQELGRELVLLDPSRVAALALPERLAEAIALARTITQHEAKRRQMQYIGRLMRDVDPKPLREALARGTRGSQASRDPLGSVESLGSRDPRGSLESQGSPGPRDG